MNLSYELNIKIEQSTKTKSANHPKKYDLAKGDDSPLNQGHSKTKRELEKRDDSPFTQGNSKKQNLM